MVFLKTHTHSLSLTHTEGGSGKGERDGERERERNLGGALREGYSFSSCLFMDYNLRQIVKTDMDDQSELP